MKYPMKINYELILIEEPVFALSACTAAQSQSRQS